MPAHTVTADEAAEPAPAADRYAGLPPAPAEDPEPVAPAAASIGPAEPSTPEPPAAPEPSGPVITPDGKPSPGRAPSTAPVEAEVINGRPVYMLYDPADGQDHPVPADRTYTADVDPESTL